MPMSSLEEIALLALDKILERNEVTFYQARHIQINYVGFDDDESNDIYLSGLDIVEEYDRYGSHWITENPTDEYGLRPIVFNRRVKWRKIQNEIVHPPQGIGGMKLTRDTHPHIFESIDTVLDAYRL